MTHLATELKAINMALYPSWASRSLLQSKPFSPRSPIQSNSLLVVNPLRSVCRSVQDASILLQSLFSLPLPLFTVDMSISLDCNAHPFVPSRKDSARMEFRCRSMVVVCSSAALPICDASFSLPSFRFRPTRRSVEYPSSPFAR